MNTVSVAIATMVLAAASAVAYAQPFSQAPLLGQIDADHDGKITRQETVAARERVFKRLDRNGDGVVDGRDRAGLAEDACYREPPRPEQDATRFHAHVIAPGLYPTAFTNPLLVDRNGDGWKAPGLP